MLDLNGREDTDESEREGKVALRYSAGSKCDSRNGARAGPDTCEEDLVTVFSDTAMLYEGAEIRGVRDWAVPASRTKLSRLA